MAKQTRAYSIVLVGSEGDPLTSPTLPLVAALIALDCYPRKDCPFKQVFEAWEDGEPGKRTHVWAFHERSACGRYHTDQLRKWWRNPEWLDANRSHPLAMIRVAFHVAEVLSLDDLVNKELSESDAAISPAVAAAARFAVHAQQVGPLPPEWHDKTHRRAYLGTDPRAIVGCAFALLPQLRAELETSVPLLRVRKGEKHVEIPADATPEEEAFLLGKLESK